MIRARFRFVLPLLLALLQTSAAFGDPGFNLERVSPGVYAINGSSLEGVAALDFTVSYDQSGLTRPVVARGGVIPADASFIANTAIAGEVRVLVVRGRELSGGGLLATITFERLPGGDERILGFKSRPVSVAAAPLDARAGAGSPPPPAEAKPIAPADSTVQHRPPAPQTSASGGGRGVAAVSGAANGGPEPPLETMPAGQEPDQAGHLLRYPSTLDRFYHYSGERSAAALLALFDAGEHGMVQEPSVALTDGAAQVTLHITVRAGSEPTFGLEGASVMHVRAEGAIWTLTVIPERGTLRAMVTVTDGDSRSEIPLTVAPPLPPDGVGVSLDEEGLARFLMSSDAATDLNGDGIHDYLDDYLFAANVRAARRGGE